MNSVELWNLRVLLDGLARGAVAAENIPLMAAFALETVDRAIEKQTAQLRVVR